MNTEHNPIAVLVSKIQQKWNEEVHPSAEYKLVRWIIRSEQARLYEGFLKLDEEVAALRKQRKKRQMSFERRQKRDHRVKARNLVDRREIEADLKPRA